MDIVNMSSDSNYERINDMLDDKVEQWHTQGGAGKSLHEYLGMTWEEYGQWAPHPHLLPRRIYHEVLAELAQGENKS